MQPRVINETNTLKLVVLGIADDFGGTPTVDHTYDPKSKQHVLDGTFPQEVDLRREMENFRKVLVKHNIEVIRPENQPGVNQVFARDIGFVIDETFIIPNIIEDRHKEALSNFEKAGLSDYIDARLADAHKLVEELEGPFDFVFTDADKEWYKNYFTALAPKLEVGGCFTAHNVLTSHWQGIGEFLDYVRNLPNFETTIDKSSQAGISISCKKAD